MSGARNRRSVETPLFARANNGEALKARLAALRSSLRDELRKAWESGHHVARRAGRGDATQAEGPARPNWLAHDGLWFQAVESRHGMDAAIEADRAAWAQFTVVEAKRILERLGLQPGGGIPTLLKCLEHRL